MTGLGADSADARPARLGRIKVVNGSDYKVASIRIDLTQKQGGDVVFNLPAVDPGKIRNWYPRRCCILAKSATIRLCIQVGKKQRTLMCRYPLSAAEEGSLGNETIRWIKISVAQGVFGKPTAQAVFMLSDRRFAIRSFVPGSSNACEEKKRIRVPVNGDDEDEPEGPRPQEPHPFVRLRLKNGSDRHSKRAEARGYYDTGTTALQTHTILSPPQMMHDFDDATSPGFGTEKSTKVKVCVQVDLNNDGDGTDHGEYFNGMYDFGDVNCRIRRVDVEVMADYSVYAYIVVWAAKAAHCSGLTPDDELPDSHKGLPVKKVQLAAANACNL